MPNYSIQSILSGLAARDWRALSRAITIVENNEPGREEILDYAYRHGNEDCLVFGITGAGGAGKSTTIDSLLQTYHRQGKTVGILAIDPSSSYTGGAVLGDRIRMTRQTSVRNFFIRSFGSRGTLGGMSRGAKDALYLYKAYGFDYIIIESLGVGQAETDITDFVDVTCVILAPGNGDYVQLAKAGTQEIADIFVVNKADSAEAEALYRQLLSTFDFLPEEKRPAVLQTVARDHKGTGELAVLLAETAERLLSKRNIKKKLRIRNEIRANALLVFDPVLNKEIETLTDIVLQGGGSPFEAARRLGEKLQISP